MIKLIKIGNDIYENYAEKYTDSSGNDVWLIPTDVDEFRLIVIDTIGWRAGEVVKDLTGDFVKLSASNSKAIAIIAKLLDNANIDTDCLTDLEKSAWDLLVGFGKNGYGDSQLLNNSLNAVSDYVDKSNDSIQDAINADSIDDLIDVLNNLF